MPLTDAQIERYSRQIILPEVGGRGQETLLQSAVALVGIGEVGRIAAWYLAGAGIGRLDVFAIANDPALESLGEDLADLNPDVSVHTGILPNGTDRSPAWAGPYHVLIDTTGNPDTLSGLNAAAIALRIPLIAGGVRGARGWLAVFEGHDATAPCVSCADIAQRGGDGSGEHAPLTAAAAGVIASLQTLEAIKLRLGIETRATGIWLQYDAEALTMTERLLSKRPDCSACGPRSSLRI